MTTKHRKNKKKADQDSKKIDREKKQQKTTNSEKNE